MKASVKYTAVVRLVSELVRVRGLAARAEGEEILASLDGGDNAIAIERAKNSKRHHDTAAFSIREGIQQIIALPLSKD